MWAVAFERCYQQDAEWVCVFVHVRDVQGEARGFYMRGQREAASLARWVCGVDLLYIKQSHLSNSLNLGCGDNPRASACSVAPWNLKKKNLNLIQSLFPSRHQTQNVKKSNQGRQNFLEMFWISSVVALLSQWMQSASAWKWNVRTSNVTVCSSVCAVLSWKCHQLSDWWEAQQHNQPASATCLNARVHMLWVLCTVCVGPHAVLQLKRSLGRPVVHPGSYWWIHPLSGASGTFRDAPLSMAFNACSTQRSTTLQEYSFFYFTWLRRTSDEIISHITVWFNTTNKKQESWNSECQQRGGASSLPTRMDYRRVQANNPRFELHHMVSFMFTSCSIKHAMVSITNADGV